MPNDFIKTEHKPGKVLSFERDTSFFVKRGDAKRAKNDPVNAMNMYNEALERDPFDYDTRLAAAELLTDMSRYNDSNRLLIPYMHKDEFFCREAYCNVGFNLLAMGFNEGARICFNRFFEMTDEVSARTDAILDALDYIESFDSEPGALAEVSEAEFDVKMEAARRAFDSGDFKTSAQLLAPLEKNEPDNREVLYQLALSNLCDGKPREARAYAEKIISSKPDDVSAISLALLCAKSLGNEFDIASLAKRLEKCETDDRDELYRLNAALLECGRFEQAEASAKKLVKMEPYIPLANHRLGVCLMKQGRYAKAEELYDKLVKIDKNDRVARYFRKICTKAQDGSGSAFVPDRMLVHYQIPFPAVLEEVRSIVENKDLPVEHMIETWNNDPVFRSKVRWAFGIREYNISCAMVAVLRIIGDESAQLLLREAISDIEVSDAVINEALGALKALNAPEPYFAMAAGRLLEGRVNIVDMMHASVPRSYREIFPRFRRSADGLYSNEIYSTGASLAEQFLIGNYNDYKPISTAQSEALSAALEFLACERCGVLAADDILERYAVSERRFENAVNRFLSVVMTAGEKAAALEKEQNGDKEDE
ncbi:MAG: tetratricopeptide repeat protein [Clostridia bacterium]|nr:tetratricopeptide repeat protein [Clostridia bacterium]